MKKLLIFLFIFFSSFQALFALELEKVKVQLQWKYQFQFAGFIMAKELGYYKNVGFDVEFLEYSPNYSTQQLTDGEVDYLISNSRLLYKNKQLAHVTLLATYFQKSPLVIIAQKDIHSIRDLVGKKIMINPSEAIQSPLAILLRQFHISSKNATFVNGVNNLDAFISHQVDAAAAFRSNEVYLLDKLNYPYNIIEPSDYGYASSAINLFTSHENLLDHPKKVEAFLEATKKGWKYALEHIEQTVNIIHRKYNTTTSIDALMYEAEVTQELMMTNLYEIGEVDEGGVLSEYNRIVKSGFLDEQQNIDLNLLTYNSFLHQKHLYLTHKERTYVYEHKTLRICVDPKWKPFEWIDEKGYYRGMGADYLRYFTDALGFEKIELYKTNNWAESLSAIKSKKCDLLPMAGITPEREKFLDFSPVYYEAPYVIATKQDTTFIENIAQKLDKKYAVVRGSAIIDDLKRHYPSIKIVKVDDILQGLNAVKSGEVYGFINVTTAIVYLIQKEGFTDIKIAGKLPFGFRIAVATRDDKPMLHEIFSKVVAHLQEVDKKLIESRWISTIVEKRQDYTLVYQLLVLILLIVIAFVYRHIVLKRANDSLKQKIDDKTKELRELNKELENLVEKRTRQLEHQAFYDPLTELPNKALFQKKLEKSLENADKSKKKLALLFIDLDRFKQINDSLGHHVGDEVLRLVAQRLLLTIAINDTLSRLGGDEFTLIIENIENLDRVKKSAQKILDALSEPIEINGTSFYISPSIGISIYPEDGDIVNLLKNADAAMYKAKDEGRNNYQFYSSEMTQEALDKVMLQGSLRQAIENDEFIVYYQPQVDAKAHKVVGLEALVRWVHPQDGIVSPADFIPLAEETGLIVDIDKIVMKKAMEQVALWHKKDMYHGTLSLNLAAKQLAKPTCLEFLQSRLQEYSFDPSWLELEVTESDIMQHPTEAIAKLEKIHSLGIRISIDDFGTGYSSLSYLKRFPIDKLKIDQSFVRDIPENEDDVAIVRAVIALGNSLGMSLIAEGVETQEQKEFLVENGCSKIQGYFYAKPMVAKELEKFFKTFGV